MVPVLEMAPELLSGIVLPRASAAVGFIPCAGDYETYLLVKELVLGVTPTDIHHYNRIIPKIIDIKVYIDNHIYLTLIRLGMLISTSSGETSRFTLDGGQMKTPAWRRRGFSVRA
jgi:hypothetical protein